MLKGDYFDVCFNDLSSFHFQFEFQGSFRGTKSTYFDDRSSTNNQFSSSSINHRESSLDESSQEHLQQKEQSKQSKEQETFTHQQLLALIVNSQVQQQNQFQQIMKNSLAVLEVMTNNMNSMSMLMSSHMVQQSSVVNEFAKNVNEHAQTSELKEENTGSQSELQAKHKLNSFGEPLTKETSALKSDKTEMFASKKFPQKLDDELWTLQKFTNSSCKSYQINQIHSLV